MNNLNSTKVIEKLIDLELLFKLKADLTKFKRKKEQELLDKTHSTSSAA